MVGGRLTLYSEPASFAFIKWLSLTVTTYTLTVTIYTLTTIYTLQVSIQMENESGKSKVQSCFNSKSIDSTESEFNSDDLER